MLVLISPSKTLSTKSYIHTSPTRDPLFVKEATSVIKALQKLTPSRLSKILGITKTLAYSTHNKHIELLENDNKRPAVFMFGGEVYLGLNPQDWSLASLEYADKHLLIFSGLYGLLKPSDSTSPYRLDIKNKLKIPKFSSLSAFWKPIIHNYFSQHVHTDLVLNLASSEYSGLLSKKDFKQWIDVVFLEQDGKKMTSKTVFTKRARGMMARFVIEQHVNDPADLLRFASGGYRYYPKLSKPGELVFVKKKQV